METNQPTNNSIYLSIHEITFIPIDNLLSSIKNRRSSPLFSTNFLSSHFAMHNKDETLYLFGGFPNDLSKIISAHLPTRGFILVESMLVVPVINDLFRRKTTTPTKAEAKHISMHPRVEGRRMGSEKKSNNGVTVNPMSYFWL